MEIDRHSDAPPLETDILLVGLGPVGAAMANLLGRYGVRTLVIDRATEIFMAPRAIALDNDALRILQLAGLAEDAFARIAIPFVRMRSPFLGEFGRVNTLGAIDGHPKLVTFYQPDLERALRAALAVYPSVRRALGVTLEGLAEQGDAVAATLRLADGRAHVLQARYVVGADGARSRVRQSIGLDFKGRSFAQDWLIVDAADRSHPIDHVEFICDHRRPIPHMPAPGGRERWEFMLNPGETAAEMETRARADALLAPWSAGGKMTVERQAVYRFHARVASAFSKGRVFLAGDAAHITPPFVGQGLVSGLRDAANLAWKLAFVLQGRAVPAVLDTYTIERRPHARAMITLARLMGGLVMPRSAAVALATHGFMRLVRLIPPLRDHIEELGIKPKNRFRKGLFVEGRSRCRLKRGGVLAQGWVKASDGRILLSDEALGPNLALIGFGRDARAGLDDMTQAAFAAAGGIHVQITQRGQRLHVVPERCFEDLHGVFLPGAAPFGWVAVVRPDRVILHEGPVSEAGRIVRESLAALGAPPSKAGLRRTQTGQAGMAEGLRAEPPIESTTAAAITQAMPAAMKAGR